MTVCVCMCVYIEYANIVDDANYKYFSLPTNMIILHEYLILGC